MNGLVVMVHTYIHTEYRICFLQGKSEQASKKEMIYRKAIFGNSQYIPTYVVFRMRDVNERVEYLGRLSVGGVDDE